MPTLARVTTLISVVLLHVVAASAGAQRPEGVRPEVIRGRVTTDSGIPLPGAEVTATMAPDREIFRASTDSSGRYEMRIPNGTGDYLVHIGAPGWRSVRKRVTRAGDDSVFVVDAALAPQVQQLAPVRVQAQRQRPRRGPEFGTGTGASERLADGVPAALTPDQQGDLAAIAATVPGIMLDPNGGISALGLDASQSQTTLNGMSFAGGAIPRDARTRTRVSTSTYDPSRGGFSGAQVALELAPGGQFTFRRAHLTLDPPQLQYTDPVAERLGQRFTRLQASAGGNGELVENRFYYNASAQLSRRVSDAFSLLNAGDAALRGAGVSADSAARLVTVLDALGVPAGFTGIADSRAEDEASVIARIDHRPFDPRTQEPSPRTWGFTGYGRLARSRALGFIPTATPASGGESSRAIGTLQAHYSFYFFRDWLSEIQSGVSVTRDAGDPYLELPTGRVLVSSAFPDGTGGVTSLLFGGNSALHRRATSWTWETNSETQFYAYGRAGHRVKLYAQSRLEYDEREPVGNRLGSFSFNSLSDLEANRPASFSRILDAPVRTGGLWSGALALGDQWRPTQRLSLIYGARLEGNVFTRRPAFNPAVLETFGARTDNAPDRVHVSPRLGFTWVYGGAERSGMSMSGLATIYTGPRGVLRGGIGEFRNAFNPTLLSEASVATGLPGGARRLMCIGEAAPAPDWRAFAADPTTIPAACADGATVFTDTAPSVQLFDRGYDAERSWRANLGWSATVKRVTLGVDGILSLNLDQPGRVDLNFAGVRRFTLPDEANRPVFVSPSSIVPASGAVSPVEARVSREFSRVVSHRSDLRSASRQLTLTATPDLPLGRYFLRAAYSLAEMRALRRGFDGATFGDPRDEYWARGDRDVRHQFQLQAGYATRWISITLFGRLNSGLPYTPVAGGDLNGDGFANDRAFIFDPQMVSDSALAEGMRSLLTAAPASVRKCLERQLGRIAAPASCTGPWTQALNVRLAVSNRVLNNPVFRTGNRVNLALNLANPLGGLDQLLHGSESLRGWGTRPMPNPVLYTVRGFDPEAQRFTYEVNPRFGTVHGWNSSARAPFRVTLDVSIDWGQPLGEQQLERWLKPGRAGRPGPRLDPAELQRRYSRNVPDPFQAVLRETDSLLLTPGQVAAVERLAADYRRQADSVWFELSQYLAELGDSYDAAEALRRSEAAIDSVWEISRLEVKKLRDVLDPMQLRLLPYPAGMLYNARERLRIRIYMSP